MKKIGFLSFGHWSDHPSCKTLSADRSIIIPVNATFRFFFMLF
jgi:hypothetical protein